MNSLAPTRPNTVPNPNRHPNANWRARWNCAQLDSGALVTHESGLSVRITPGDEQLVWKMKLAAPLPIGFPVDPNVLMRTLYEGLRLYQETALEGQKINNAVLPWTRKDFPPNLVEKLDAQWRRARSS